MDGHLRISAQERKRLLHALHRAPRPDERLRWNIILLLVDGRTWAHICAVLYCSTATIARWHQRYLKFGMAGIAPVHEQATLSWWVARIVVWIQSYTPTHFGYLRSRWCCSTLVLLLAREYGVHVGRETVCRCPAVPYDILHFCARVLAKVEVKPHYPSDTSCPFAHC